MRPNRPDARRDWTRKEPIVHPYESVLSKREQASPNSSHLRQSGHDESKGSQNGVQHGIEDTNKPAERPFDSPRFRVRFLSTHSAEERAEIQADPSQWPQLQRAQRNQPQDSQSPPATSLPARRVSQRTQRPPFDQLDVRKIASQGYLPFSPSVNIPTCSYCGVKGHVEDHCSQRKTTSGYRPIEAQPSPDSLMPRQSTESFVARQVSTPDDHPLTLRQKEYGDAEKDRPSTRSRTASLANEEDTGTRRKKHTSRRDLDDEDDLGEKRKVRRPSRREVDEEDDDDRDYSARRAPRQRRYAADEELDEMDKMERKRQKKREKQQREKEKAARGRSIHLPEFINVNNLAQELGVRLEDFMIKLQELGFSGIGNDHVLNAENAGLIAMEYGFEATIDTAETSKDILRQPMPEDMSSLPPRPPVVTIMGHVDHGKTTILDFLRKSSIAASEHGGITQHIGAFSVPLSGGKMVTFLDTPGHAAFLAMRQRGANVTDIVILVVAADDSVMPQTIEAIKHAKAAKVPMIVALNKIDKEDARPEMVKQDLARHGVEVEDFGGETQVVAVSGKTGQGMQELEEAVVALSEMLDHRAPSDGSVEGWVLEATTKKAGKVATVLVRRGTLRLGDIVVAGTTFARVRSLRNEAGLLIAEAGPGVPVEVDGWRGQPGAGDELLQAPNEQKASAVADYRQARAERQGLAEDMEAINEARRLEQEKREREATIAKAKEEGKDEEAVEEIVGDERDTTPRMKEIFFIVKADVAGSAEAVANAISHLGNGEVRPHILRSGVGAVSQFDIDHAAAARGHIISFNTNVEPRMMMQAEKEGVEIIDQSIIYRLVEDVTAKLEEALPPAVTQRVTGEAEIAMSFNITVKGRQTIPIAGCKIRNGVISRGSKVRVLRGSNTVYDGESPNLTIPCSEDFPLSR
jgi:translation initiation factor IF-2